MNAHVQTSFGKHLHCKYFSLLFMYVLFLYRSYGTRCLCVCVCVCVFVHILFSSTLLVFFFPVFMYVIELRVPWKIGYSK